jgi:pimeloyl-ACP methyl ester carboxylesterase
MALVRKIFKWTFIGLLSLIIVTLVGGGVYQMISESRDLARHPAPGELIAVDDHLMHINCIGQGNPTVIFELGIGSVSASWDEVHRQISQLTRACAYDRPGLGYSEPIDLPTRSTDVARRLHKLLNGAEVEDELVLVGWSAGGVYVREFYRQYPEKVKAMLFVDSSHEQQAKRLPQSSGGGSDPALRIARHLAPFGIIRLSGILNHRIDAGTGSDELKSRLKAIYHQSHMLDAVFRESESFELDINAMQPPSPIGDIPLIVLTRGRSVENTEDTSSDSSLKLLQQEWEARNQLQKELTALSTNGKQIIASESGHHIYSDQPELVIDSIEELVLLVRGRQQSNEVPSN